MNAQHDKRRHDRAASRSLGLRVTLPGCGDAIRSVVALNVAEEGLCLVGTLQARPGMPAMVWLRAAGQAEAIECKARVCWTRPAGAGMQRLGLRFVDLSYTERETLRDWVQAPAQPVEIGISVPLLDLAVA